MPDEEQKQNFISDLFGAQPAEAMPVGKLVKKGTERAAKAVKGVESRTAKMLVGEQFKGQEIKAVTKGRGDWRYIVLEDDSVYPVTKDVVADMTRAIGTSDKLRELRIKTLTGASGDGSPLSQAYKSLEYHKKRILPGQNEKVLRDWYKNYKQNLLDANQVVPKLAIVKHAGDRPFTMPLEYAKLLGAEKVITIEGMLE